MRFSEESAVKWAFLCLERAELMAVLNFICEPQRNNETQEQIGGTSQPCACGQLRPVSRCNEGALVCHRGAGEGGNQDGETASKPHRSATQRTAWTALHAQHESI